jgi:hypothetical protein
MEEIPSSQLRVSASREIPNALWDPSVHHRVRIRPLLDYYKRRTRNSEELVAQFLPSDEKGYTDTDPFLWYKNEYQKH